MSVVPVDLDVEQVGKAWLRIDAAVGQLDVNGHMPVLDAQFGDPPLVVEYVALAGLKDDVDGVLADDRRKRPGGRADQIADGENGKPDPSVDRRTDFGVAEIDFRLVERRLRRQHIGLRYSPRRPRAGRPWLAGCSGC